MSSDPFDVAGRVIIVTGGGGLLGTRYVGDLARRGVRVVVADADEDAAVAAARTCPEGSAIPVPTDVSNPASVKAMVAEVAGRWDRIDGLVNNAALDPKFEPHHRSHHAYSFEEFPLDQWRRALDVNVTGMFLCAQAVAPFMLRQRRGTIVNISSTYGLVGPDQRIYGSDDPAVPAGIKPATYSVGKSAVLGLTVYLATYWGGKGIRVNTLTLGGVFNNHDPEFVRRYSARTPLGRMARPDEYCGALLFLLSDASSYMTGANLVVDGGWTAW